MKKNRTKWWHLLAFLPIAILLPAINYVVDPGEVFHSSSRSMAKYWLQGNDVAYLTANGDIRQFKYYVITGAPEHMDCVVVGPSLSLPIQAATVGGNDVLNISVNDATFYDMIGELGLLEALGRQYDRLIMCLDAEFFTYGKDEKSPMHPLFIPYANYLLERLDGAAPPAPVLTEEQEAQISWQTKLETAFSVSYFQSAIDTIRTQDKWWANAFRDDQYCIVDSDTYTGVYYRHLDCGMVYSKDLQEAGVDEVAKSIRSYEFPDAYREHLDAYNIEYLDKLIGWLLEKGIKIQLWICPLPQSLWDRLDLDQYPLMPEIEECVQTLGKKYPEIKVTGSYDPYRYGVTDADFYDYRHMRLESIEKYFDFTWP